MKIFSAVFTHLIRQNPLLFLVLRSQTFPQSSAAFRGVRGRDRPSDGAARLLLRPEAHLQPADHLLLRPAEHHLHHSERRQVPRVHQQVSFTSVSLSTVFINFPHFHRNPTPTLFSDKYCFCAKCFNDIQGDNVALCDDPSAPAM